MCERQIGTHLQSTKRGLGERSLYVLRMVLAMPLISGIRYSAGFSATTGKEVQWAYVFHQLRVGRPTLLQDVEH